MKMTALVYPFPLPAGVHSRPARVWLLLSNRVGDNHQLFALAEALGYPFEVKDLQFNQLRKFRPLYRSGLAIVASSSRRKIEPPWPDLVIGAGYPAVPVARHIRKASGGSAKIVHVGNARGQIDDFDLHLTTPQYPTKGSGNTIELRFPIGNPAKTVQPTLGRTSLVSRSSSSAQAHRGRRSGSPLGAGSCSDCKGDWSGPQQRDPWKYHCSDQCSNSLDDASASQSADGVSGAHCRSVPTLCSPSFPGR